MVFSSNPALQKKMFSVDIVLEEMTFAITGKKKSKFDLGQNYCTVYIFWKNEILQKKNHRNNFSQSSQALKTQNFLVKP